MNSAGSTTYLLVHACLLGPLQFVQAAYKTLSVIPMCTYYVCYYIYIYNSRPGRIARLRIRACVRIEMNTARINFSAVSHNKRYYANSHASTPTNRGSMEHLQRAWTFAINRPSPRDRLLRVIRLLINYFASRRFVRVICWKELSRHYIIYIER